MSGLSEKMIDFEKEFIARLSSLTENSPTPKWSPVGVELIYSPLEYAFNLHNQYVRMYCDSPRKIMFLGMNPGPYGMVQTGVSVFKILKTTATYLQILDVIRTCRYHSVK